MLQIVGSQDGPLLHIPENPTIALQVCQGPKILISLDFRLRVEAAELQDVRG